MTLTQIYEFIWGSSPTYVPVCPNPSVKQGAESQILRAEK